MVTSIIGILLILLGLTALALQRFYSSVPAHELKRLAGRHDELARALYRPVAYDGSLRLFLWIIIILALGGGIVLLANGLMPLAATTVLLLTLTASLVILPSARLTVRTAKFAAWVGPAIAAVLERIEPVFGRISHLVRHKRKLAQHSGLYEKEDLLALLLQQKEQTDNRIPHDHLELIHRAVRFDDAVASEVVIKQSDLKLVKASDAIGPILLEELHKSGENSFVVTDEAGKDVIGTVHLSDAIRAKQGGKVSDVMRVNLCYVHEDFSLRQVLSSLSESGQPMAMVVNGFEEMVGVITLGAITEQLFGETKGQPVVYDDKAAVAKYEPKSQTQEAATDVVSEDAPQPDLSSPETTEVVE